MSAAEPRCAFRCGRLATAEVEVIFTRGLSGTYRYCDVHTRQVLNQERGRSIRSVEYVGAVGQEVTS